MNAKTLKNILEKGDEHVLLIDVREPDEVSDEPYFEVPPDNYLPLSLTILSVLPREEFSEKIMGMLDCLGWEVGSVQIVTLCRSGRRSEVALSYIARLGLSLPAESLDGGYGAWMMENNV